MNKVFKVVWSNVKNCYVVVSELAKTCRKSPAGSSVNRLLAAGVLLCLLGCSYVRPVFAADQTVSGKLTVTSTSALKGTTTVGTTDANANLVVHGKSTVDGTSTLKGATTVGTSSANANLKVNGNSTVTGLTTSGALTVTGQSTLKSLDVSGKSTLGSTYINNLDVGHYFHVDDYGLYFGNPDQRQYMPYLHIEPISSGYNFELDNFNVLVNSNFEFQPPSSNTAGGSVSGCIGLGRDTILYSKGEHLGNYPVHMSIENSSMSGIDGKPYSALTFEHSGLGLKDMSSLELQHSKIVFDSYSSIFGPRSFMDGNGTILSTHNPNIVQSLFNDQLPDSNEIDDIFFATGPVVDSLTGSGSHFGNFGDSGRGVSTIFGGNGFLTLAPSYFADDIIISQTGGIGSYSLDYPFISVDTSRGQIYSKNFNADINNFKVDINGGSINFISDYSSDKSNNITGSVDTIDLDVGSVRFNSPNIYLGDNIFISGNKITGLGPATLDSDAVNFSQLTSEVDTRTLEDNKLSNRLTALETASPSIPVSVSDGVMTMEGENGVKITNLKQAVLSADSKDAVTGSQLYATNRNISGFSTDISKNKQAIRDLNSTITSALDSFSSLNTYIDAMGDSRADTNLTNLSNAGKKIIRDEALAAVRDYMSQNGTSASNVQKPMALMAVAPKSPQLMSFGDTSGDDGVDVVTSSGDGDVDIDIPEVDTGTFSNEYYSSTGVASTAVGPYAQATGGNSLALGHSAYAKGHISTAIGWGTNANGIGNTVIGADSVANGTYNTLVGVGSTISGNSSTDSILIGNRSTTNGSGHVVIGSDSTAQGTASVAVGDTSRANGTNSVSMGVHSASNATRSVALGAFSVATSSENDVVSVGHAPITTYYDPDQMSYHFDYGPNGELIISKVMTSVCSYPIGGDSEPQEYKRRIIHVADGVNDSDAATVGQVRSMTDHSSEGLGSLAIGSGTYAKGDGSVVLGGSSTVRGQVDISLGFDNSISSLQGGNIVIGSGSSISGSGTQHSVAVGHNSHVSGTHAVALGVDSNVTGTNSVALGNNSVNNGTSSVAIGSSSYVSSNESGVVSFGHDANVLMVPPDDPQYQFVPTEDGWELRLSMMHTDWNIVSNPQEFKRRLIHVADGINASDAATVGQVMAESNVRSSADEELSNRILALESAGMGGAGSLPATVSNDVLTLAGDNGIRITNLKAGALTADSKDAVTGAQLYATNRNVSAFASDINRNKTAVRELNSTVSSALDSFSSLNSYIDAMGESRADANLANLSNSGRQVIANAAAKAVSDYMALHGIVERGVAAPAAPAGSLAVTDAGNGSLHVGEGSSVNGTSSIAIGVGNQVNANNAGAFGDPSIINADASYVLGNDDTVNTGAKGSFIVGNDSVSNAEGSLILGSHVTSDGKNGMALGNHSSVTAENAVALGSQSVANEENTVSVGNDTLKRKIVNVMNGSVENGSNDAVTGGQLFETNERVKSVEDSLSLKANTDASDIDVAKWSEKLGKGVVEQGNDGLVTGGTVYDVITAYNDVAPVTFDSANRQIRIGGKSTFDEADSINVSKSDGTSRVITGVATDANDSSSAANVGYVNAIGQQIMSGVNDSFAKVDDKFRKAGASAAAMASLEAPPMDGDEKWAFSAAVGHYDGKTAGAVGAFFRPQDNVMVNVRGAAGNGEDMIGAGIGISLNRGNTPGVSKAQMVRTINAQAQEINVMKAGYTEQANRVQQLEQMVQALAESNQKLEQKIASMTADK